MCNERSFRCTTRPFTECTSGDASTPRVLSRQTSHKRLGYGTLHTGQKSQNRCRMIAFANAMGCRRGSEKPQSRTFLSHTVLGDGVPLMLQLLIKACFLVCLLVYCEKIPHNGQMSNPARTRRKCGQIPKSAQRITQKIHNIYTRLYLRPSPL